MKSRVLIIIGIIIAIGNVTTILAMNFLEDKKTTVSDTSPKQLEAIMEYCIDSKVLVDTVGLSYYNNTHFIDTITCEWQRHDGVEIDSEGLDANSEFEFTQKLKNARDILLENQDIIPWTGLGVSTSEKAVTISIDDENPEEYRKIIEKLVGEDIPIIIKKGGDPFINSGWVIGEDYCQEWCGDDELYKMGCEQPILAHLVKYSNLLDEEFDGTFNLDWISLPNGVSTEKFEWCVDFIYEKLTLLSKSVVTDSLKIPNTERDVKLAAGYKLYPGVGWVHPDDQGNQEPLDRDNPNNPGELVLDIDAMLKYQKVLDWCHRESLGLGVFDIGLSFNNETHYIDNNKCQWQLLENYPNSDNLCIPGQHVEDNEHRIRNGTHIYDNQSCMWEEDEICTGYCGELENEK